MSGAICSTQNFPQPSDDQPTFFPQPDSKRLAELGGAMARGELVIPIAKRFPLAEAAVAHALAERGGIGKVLLVP